MSLRKKTRKIYEYFEPNLILAGIIGVIGFPLYYIIWKYIFPQQYESITLRVIFGAAFLPLLLSSKMPPLFLKYKQYYNLFFIGFSLPYFFGFMLLKNDWSTIWLMSIIASIYLSVMLLRDWLYTLSVSAIGYSIALLTVYIIDGHFHFDNFEWSYMAVFIFSYITALLFNHQHKRENNERMMFARSISASIAHEVRNPLSAIRSLLEVLKIQIPSQSWCESDISNNFNDFDEIHENINNGLAIIDSGNNTINLILKSINTQRISIDNFRRHSLNKVIENSLKNYGYSSESDKKLIKFKAQYEAYFLGCDNLLQYVIFNLLKNALYYKDSKGFSINVTIEEQSGQHLIKIKDTGVGISATELNYIFDDFYTSGKIGNTGVGLPFCKRVISSFSGKIECYSELGKWTEFIISIPDYNASTANKMKDEVLSRKKIVLVTSQDNLNKPIVSRLVEDFSNIEILDSFNIEKKMPFTFDILIVDTECHPATPNNSHYLSCINNHNKTNNILLLTHLNEGNFKLTDTYGIKTYESINDSIDWIKELLLQPSLRINHLSQASKPIDIMVVDDSPSILSYSSLLLKSQGYNVIQAESGATALRYLKKYGADIVLMDLEMPVMDGVEITETIRNSPDYSNLHSIPIICYTGNTSSEVIETALSAGMNDIISKPTTKSGLISKVEHWVQSIHTTPS